MSNLVNKPLKRILVLGANSFAGAAYIKKASSPSTRIVGVSRSELSSLTRLIVGQNDQNRYEQIDINLNLPDLLEIFESFQPEVIIDFAGQGMVAESWSNPNQWYTTNLISKIKILEFLKKKSWLKKYIRISTPEVYGSNQDSMVEGANFNPSTPYAVSHAAIDMNLKIYFERYAFPVVIGRFANFYGPGQQLYRIVPKSIISVLSGNKFPLHGGGVSERSFIYTDDFVSGIQKMVSSGNLGEVYHFSNPEIISIFDLVNLIGTHMGVKIENFAVKTIDRPSKDQRYLMNSTKAEKELGWSSNTNLDAGIERTVDWFTSNYTKLLGIPLEYIHRA
jgi:dTDP-glucose 4,6-dehydratase